MDTKLKKSKIITSYVWLFLGIFSLILPFMVLNSIPLDSIDYLFMDDYQESHDFKNHISDRLQTFIMMALDETYEGYSYSTNGYVEKSIGATVPYEYDETTATQHIDSYSYVVTELASDNIVFDIDWNKSVEMANLNRDKNLLYAVFNNGKLLYSNYQDTGVNLLTDTLPSEEYNFFLYFDGEKVSINKDGTEIDVYGDGYYDNTSEWFVPGYKNFETNNSLANVSIYMSAAKTPVSYSKYGYLTDSNNYYQSSLYEISQQIERYQFYWKIVLAFFVAMIIIWIICIATRKFRKEGSRLIAEFTGKIIFELKIILNLMLFLGITVICEFICECLGLYNDIYFIMAICFAGVICLFISANDCKYNRNVLKNSFCYKMSMSARANELALPLSKRIVHRFRFFIYLWVLAIIALFFFMILMVAEFYEIGLLFDVIVFIITAFVSWIFIGILKENKQLACDLEIIEEKVTAIHKGDFIETNEFPTDSDLYAISEKLDDIQNGMKTAIDEQLKSERMKVELITNVSHDLKTPLTSIISYIELLKNEDELPDYAKDYVKILDEKANRLNSMVQDIFTVSKAVSGELPVNLETIDFAKLIRQTLADMNEQIETGNVTLKISLPDDPVMILADGERMYRVFQNLIQNALKYSLEGSRIYISLNCKDTFATASIKNTSAIELSDTVDFTERFVRGDSSRTDGGSGLGLSIAKSFTENCGGTFELSTNADLFVVTITFPII